MVVTELMYRSGQYTVAAIAKTLGVEPGFDLPPPRRRLISLLLNW